MNPRYWRPRPASGRTFKARHLTDVGDAREVSQLVRAKYGPEVAHSTEGQPPNPGEQASFELTPG